MELKLARHLWGTQLPYRTAFQLYQAQGYSAIEASLLYLAEPKETFYQLLQEFNFAWIPMIFTHGNSVQAHLESFASQIKATQALNPLQITAHSGQDAFTRQEAIYFFQEALKIEKDFGIPIAHETHRSRIFYNPWITQEILSEFTQLKLCADYSHWVTVCERLLDDSFASILELCAERSIHIHARVGHEQGPQVSDPRDQAYQAHVLAHESWWDMIWSAQRQSKKLFSTLTPEFGPAPYLPTMPHTQQPLSSQEEICLWQANRQRQRFTDWLKSNEKANPTMIANVAD